MGPHRQLAAALLAVVVLTSGCDPGHPFDDARVKIQVREDGIALVAADVFPEGMRNGLDAVGDGELSAAVAHAMDVGSIVGEPATYADEFGFETVAVDLLLRSSQAQLTIPLRPLVDALLQHGVDPTATVFFSICHAAGDGGVSGTSVDLVARSSCAVWEGSFASLPDDAVVRVDPSPDTSLARLVPEIGFWLFSALGAIGVIGLAPRWHRTRHAWRSAVAIAVFGILAICTASAVRRGFDDPFVDAGQVVGGPPSVTFARGLVAIATIIVAGVIQHARSVRRVADG